ncbi:MAG: helicase RepA family protein, partial [Actinobacteria bacterium]|nr:helicase RepA family protein [Actinomycetota bacterium]
YDITDFFVKLGKTVDDLFSYEKLFYSWHDRFTPICAKDLVEKESKPFPYLIDKLIPENAITALTADTGQGKSLISYIFIKSLLSGKDLFGTFKVKKTKVLIIDQEMDEDLIIGRVKSIFDDGDNLNNLNIIYEQSISIDDEVSFSWLIDYINKEQFGFVIFDTLTMIHNAKENDSMEMKKINQLMLELIAKTKTTIMFLHHHRKSFNGDKTDTSSSRGSTEIIAKAASHLQIESHQFTDDDGCIINEVKLSQAKARRPERINKIGFNIKYQNNKTSVEYMGEINEDLKKVDEIKKEIADVFTIDNSPRTFEAINLVLTGRNLKYSERNIRQALREMTNNGELLGRKKKQMVEDGLLTDDNNGTSNRSIFYTLNQ